MEGSVVNSQKKIFDAIAAASIFTNCAGIDTNNSQVITISTFTKFLETRQMEVWTEDQVKALIHVSAPRKALESPHSTNYFFFVLLETWTRRGASCSELSVLWGFR